MARRRLPTADVLARLPAVSSLAIVLEFLGYEVAPSVGVIGRQDGGVTLRLVWRDRAAGEAITLTLAATAEDNLT